MYASAIAKLITAFNTTATIIIACFAAAGVLFAIIKIFRFNILWRFRRVNVLVKAFSFCVAALAAFALEATAFNFPHYLKYFAGPQTDLANVSEMAPNIGLTADGVQVVLAENGIYYSNINRKVTSIYILGDIEKVEMLVKCTDERGNTYQYAKSLHKYRPHEYYAWLRPHGKVSDLAVTFYFYTDSFIDVTNVVINKPIPFHFSGLRILFVSLLLFVFFSLVNKHLRARGAALSAFLWRAISENKRRNVILRYITLGCAFLLINGLVFIYYQNTVNKTGGEYVYPLDDTYIHLAIAKNAALYNNWGVGRDEFISSSSPLYTFTTSVLIRLFGDNAIYPLLINILFGNLIIIALYLFIKNKLWFLVSVLFLCTPILLHVQILSGMEHTMHILVILTAFMFFSKFADSGFNDKRYGVPFLCLSALLCMSRYESMFFLAAVLVILLLNKRYVFALLTVTAGFLPVLSYGIWSISNGGFFFPNSVLIKGDIAVNGVISGIVYYCDKLYRNIIKAPIFIGTIAMILVIVIQDFVLNKAYNFNALFNLIKKYAFVFIVLTTVSLHALFADFGWLFRYEAYLLVLLYFALILVINKNIRIARSCAVALSMIFILLSVPAVVDRFSHSHRVTLYAGKNIYDLCIQTAKFLKIYYNQSKVMTNDIGAITYYTDIKLKDLTGLGSNDMAMLHKGSGLRLVGGAGWESVFQKYKQEYSVIIIYDHWFGIKHKTDWERLGLIKIGELWIRDNVIAGGWYYSFYTSDVTMVEKFKDNMLKFKENVPKDVTVVVF